MEVPKESDMSCLNHNKLDFAIGTIWSNRIARSFVIFYEQ